MPGIDDRLRRDLERLAKGAEATGSLARVASRKRRHHTARRVQTVALAAVVLAATAGGGYALNRAFRRDIEDVASPPRVPTVEPSTPAPSMPSHSTPPDTSPAPIQTPVSIPYGQLEEFEGHFDPLCGTAVIGQFDGTRGQDITAVAFPLIGETCPESPGEQSWSLYNIWNDQSGGATPLPECSSTCRAFAAADLDGNGAHELFITSDEGASSRFLRVFGVPLSPIGPIRFGVASPGSGDFPGGEPLVLEYGGSVTHQAFVTCAEGDGEHHVIATVAQRSDDQTEWAVTETIFAFDSSVEAESVVTDEGTNEQHAPAFTIVSSREYTAPFEEPVPVPGNACWALD